MNEVLPVDRYSNQLIQMNLKFFKQVLKSKTIEF